MRAILPGSKAEDAMMTDTARETPPPEEAVLSAEAAILIDKQYICQACGEGFTSKAVKGGTNRANGRDRDLRPRYDTADELKYGTIVCPHCGHATLILTNRKLSEQETAAVKEWIKKEEMPGEDAAEYSYEYAISAYRAVMKDAMVRNAGKSERGYIALQTAWLLRGYAESLAEKEGGDENCAKIREAEQRYLLHALEHLKVAAVTEDYPICGMNEPTFAYLLAALSFGQGEREEAARLVARVLQNREISNNLRILAENLREEIRRA